MGYTSDLTDAQWEQIFEKALYRYPAIIAARADQGYRGTFKNTFEMFHNMSSEVLFGR